MGHILEEIPGFKLGRAVGIFRSGEEGGGATAGGDQVIDLLLAKAGRPLGEDRVDLFAILNAGRPGLKPGILRQFGLAHYLH